MKKIAAFLLLVWTITSAVKAQDTLKIMTFNIRNSAANDGKNSWEKRKKSVVTMLQNSGAEIFGVQEALDDQMQYLQSSLNDFASVGCGRDDGKKAGEYAAIFYNKKIFNCEKSGTFWLSENPTLPGSRSWGSACTRICTWAVFQIISSGKNILVCNTHFDHISSEARINSAKMVLAFADSISHLKPIIIMGDLNAASTDSCVQTFLQNSNGYLHLCEEKSPSKVTLTYHGWGKENKSDSPIDHVIISSEIFCLDYKVLREKINHRFVSDHYPLMVRLLIN